MTEVTTATQKPTINWIERTGTGLGVLGLLALAVPLLTLALGSQLLGLAISTLAQVHQLATLGLILTLVAVVVGLFATVFTVPGIIGRRNMGRIVAAIISVGTLVGSLVFLFGTVLPRVTDLQQVQSVADFGVKLRDNCQTPLNQTTADLAKARDATQANLTNDAGFAGAMSQAATDLTHDAQTLQANHAVLAGMSAPQATYQALLDQCRGTVDAENSFLTDPASKNAIALPPPYNALAATVSAIQLVQTAGQLAAGIGPVTVPAGTLEPLVLQALTQAAAATNPTLTQLGDQLKQDLKHSLTNDLAPLKVEVDAIVK